MMHNNLFNSDLPDPYAPMDAGAIVHHRSGYHAPGLLGAIITEGIHQSQASKSVTLMKPFRRRLEDFNFTADFQSKLKNSVAKLSWLNVRNQETRFNINESESNIINKSKDKVTLFVGTTYALNSVFRQLIVAAYVKLVQLDDSKNEPRVLYANIFYYVNRLPEPNNNKHENKKRWLKNNGKMLKDKLGDASSLLSSMIMMDIGNTNIEPYEKSKKIIKLKSAYGFPANGRVIKRQEDYYIAMLDDKTLYAVNENDVISG